MFQVQNTSFFQTKTLTRLDVVETIVNFCDVPKRMRGPQFDDMVMQNPQNETLVSEPIMQDLLCLLNDSDM